MESSIKEAHSYSEPPYYFQDLPAAVATGKTDADGKFTLTLPPGKYVFAATASRSVFKDTEQYAWLVNVDASKPVQGLLLSNDNEIKTGCGTCAPIGRLARGATPYRSQRAARGTAQRTLVCRWRRRSVGDSGRRSTAPPSNVGCC